MVLLTKANKRRFIRKQYVSGKGKMTSVEGGALPLALLAPLLAPAVAAAVPEVIKLAKKGKGLRPHGNGLTPHGGSLHGGLPPALVATISQLVRSGVLGRGLRPHGMDQIQGGNIFKALNKGLKRVGKFLSSKKVKKISRTIRTVGVPLLKKALPKLVPLLMTASTKIPYVGPALAPVATNPLAQAAATKGAEKGVDALNDLAAKHGYGNRAGAGSVTDAIKYTKKQLAATTKGLDKHSLQLLNNMVMSTPVRGRGIMPV